MCDRSFRLPWVLACHEMCLRLPKVSLEWKLCLLGSGGCRMMLKTHAEKTDKIREPLYVPGYVPE
jgi:hypothetical protein